MKLLSILCAILLLAGTSPGAPPQRPTIITSTIRSGADRIEVRLELSGGQIVKFDYDGARRTHECALSAARDDGATTWTDNGGTTTIRFSETPGTLTIRRQGASFRLVFSQMTGEGVCGAGVRLPRTITLSRDGRRYFGRVAW